MYTHTGSRKARTARAARMTATSTHDSASGTPTCRPSALAIRHRGLLRYRTTKPCRTRKATEPDIHSSAKSCLRGSDRSARPPLAGAPIVGRPRSRPNERQDLATEHRAHGASRLSRPMVTVLQTHVIRGRRTAAGPRAHGYRGPGRLWLESSLASTRGALAMHSTSRSPAPVASKAAQAASASSATNAGSPATRRLPVSGPGRGFDQDLRRLADGRPLTAGSATNNASKMEFARESYATRSSSRRSPGMLTTPTTRRPSAMRSIRSLRSR